ncbi:hypothetical protein GEMRC1_009012 [Eukaryota sp. GEM-RC1]
MFNSDLPDLPNVNQRFLRQQVRTIFSTPDSSHTLLSPSSSLHLAGCNGSNVSDIIKAKGPQSNRISSFTHITTRLSTLIPLIMETNNIQYSDIQYSISINSSGWFCGWIFIDENDKYCLSLNYPEFSYQPSNSVPLEVSNQAFRQFLHPSSIVMAKGTIGPEGSLKVSSFAFPPVAPLPFINPASVQKCKELRNDCGLSLCVLPFPFLATLYTSHPTQKAANGTSDLELFHKKLTVVYPDVIIICGKIDFNVLPKVLSFLIFDNKSGGWIPKLRRTIVVPSDQWNYRIFEIVPSAPFSKDIFVGDEFTDFFSSNSSGPQHSNFRDAFSKTLIFGSNPFTFDLNYCRIAALGYDISSELDGDKLFSLFSSMLSQRVLYPLYNIDGSSSFSSDFLNYCVFNQTAPNLILYESKVSKCVETNGVLFIGIAETPIEILLHPPSPESETYEVKMNCRVSSLI